MFNLVNTAKGPQYQINVNPITQRTLHKTGEGDRK